MIHALDLNPSTSLRAGAGLAQVLDDGTNTYLYGPSAGSRQARPTSSGQALDRIAQLNIATLNNIPEGGTDYFLNDAPSISLRASLGSVRQMRGEFGT
jgi:hypothetical protein